MGGLEGVCVTLMSLIILLTVLVYLVILVRRSGNNKLTSDFTSSGRVLNIHGAASLVRGVA